MATKRCVLMLVFGLAGLFAFYATSAVAGQITFVREYTYHANEIDSKVSCRAIALQQVKVLLLEELGVYIESIFEDRMTREYCMTKNEIITLTAGVVQTDIVDEKWDGQTYWIKAEMLVDPDQTIESINSLRKDRHRTKELEKERERRAHLAKEVKRLTGELALSRHDIEKLWTQYNEVIKRWSASEWVLKGIRFERRGSDKQAIDAYTNAIELDPEHPGAFKGRGLVYWGCGSYNRAIGNLNRAIQLDPEDTGAYYLRGSVYMELGDHQEAIKNFNRVIELSPKDVDAYVNRGLACMALGDYEQAIENFKMVIALEPMNADTYRGLAAAYGKLGKYQQAIENATSAIGLNPRDVKAYRYRGLAYWTLGDDQGIKDLKIAARLNDKVARDFLQAKRIQW
jgi:tetratricopeptide (TPR) repeat protein